MNEQVTRQKIDWLIENEGCELADGYEGLSTFLRYCYADKDGRLLDLISSVVDEQYELCREEMDCEGEERREIWLPENEDGTLGAVAYRSEEAVARDVPCAVRIVRFVEADPNHS